MWKVEDSEGYIALLSDTLEGLSCVLEDRMKADKVAGMTEPSEQVRTLKRAMKLVMERCEDEMNLVAQSLGY